MWKQYKGAGTIFKIYWTSYGGSAALLCSPYLHTAIVLLAFTFQTWNAAEYAPNQASFWWDQSISVLPNLLGFTLGGFAIFIGFGDEKFRALLAEKDEESKINAYVGLCSTFVHFIMVQGLALIAAVIAKSWWFHTDKADIIRPLLPYMNFAGGAIGYGLFLYALTSVIAATMHIFRIAHMYARFQETESDLPRNCASNSKATKPPR
ncbi:hypothetical protein [Paracidovorax citrulli]|uniref:hypothetical protein n=1 Tax=Paracidovorax citrulli TaxID=80869 RepID=UPI0009E22F57|nr:hypothetical protein [Paracidovorax citrulli]